MPLYEMQDEHELVPFRQLRGGADLYEHEIEDVLWANLADVTGEALFPVAKQAQITGGRPDIVALDRDARVVVIEIKRDVDRNQLAQCLEYAGWARTTSLDELAGLYYLGPEAFFADWQEFTESDAPVRIRRSPRLVLVARDFHGRTGSAFEFLIEHGLPVKLIRVSMYEDQTGRRFIDIEGEHEPEWPNEGPEEGGTRVPEPTRLDGRRVEIADLVDAGLLTPGQGLVWERPRLGETYRATLTDAAMIRLDDGREYATPSGAAMHAAGLQAYDGWYAWRLDADARPRLHDLRAELIRQATTDPEVRQGGAVLASTDPPDVQVAGAAATIAGTDSARHV